MNMVKFKLQYGGSKRSVTLWDSPSCEKGSQAGLSVPIRQLVCAREMEVRLQALHSVSIRRKKPWGKFAWLGEVGTPANRTTSSLSIFMLFGVPATVHRILVIRGKGGTDDTSCRQGII